ncbi:NnrS family protein [Lutimaribacter sp. EGI FJ00015]|uniref:NnrS family protein n=1 Tax=Lutimaribacter degradans TaxID=2945989 RepID=A0ACC5ZSI4_9RHOB|nr:NnrS family protein [Lutimaribacter sp. EGI FJ00013]MCM2561266.1 NnrS family protein [Lutimaribacter sp. EGI FJ00013]MCO0611785.1 NnrS family protein [Lutimaribacter sp. EGI FJ00015]MCO0635094.1 NnrS family protein [Lutimaribacter sp. EGI FJ00014]
MTSTSEQMRAWTGPALLTLGFRPFFFGAAVWAVLAMVLWVPMLSGHLMLPTAFDPVSWHAHEFLFGYLGAVVAGFLLTAVPNWTGRLPIVGWRLGMLALLWLVGRVGVAISAGLPAGLVAALDLAFPVVFALAIGREIVAGKNWRNLIVLAMLCVFLVGNALFHWEVARGDYAAQGYGMRLGLGAGVMMIAVIGGRVVPSFTRNWLVKRRSTSLPVPPMQRFDKAALVALLVALSLWVFVPLAALTGVALALAGVLHLLRLTRWSGHRTLAEPLVTVLHAGYAFVPLGALALAAEILLPGAIGMAGAQHFWMAGAIGLMTLAVMTRATLGHTGRALTAGAGTVAIYLALILSVLARVAAGVWPELSGPLHMMAGLFWTLAFGGFAVIYGALLLRLPAAKRV